jgi:transposase
MEKYIAVAFSSGCCSGKISPRNHVIDKCAIQLRCAELQFSVSQRSYLANNRGLEQCRFIGARRIHWKACAMSGITLPGSVFLSTRVTDMRKSIDGLCGEVSNYLGFEPMDGSLFVFYNSRRDKLKLLFWDRDGYWVMYKRLEAGTFQMPAIDTETKHIILTSEQLQLIFYGIDLHSVRHRKRYRMAS